ncbi:uncharacterized protein LOC124138398 [Haliotis rufescens]|uniref:uncharacterized protein LOC124138398 n=1 Tax=Haliotis rufescens TaxID=6454 RepID=UPI00201F5050|nr:uncharacterized protein LOC124138398 [Haliotis rufescens]
MYVSVDWRLFDVRQGHSGRTINHILHKNANWTRTCTRCVWGADAEALHKTELRRTEMASNYSSVISGKDKKSTSVSTSCDSHSSRQEQMKQFFQERQMDNNESKQTTPASCVKAQSSTNPPPNSSGQVKKVQNMMTELELM